jgi:ribosomal-protein-alanine N-acetyltransferase
VKLNDLDNIQGGFMAGPPDIVGRIRPALPADLPQILEIERLCFEKQWRQGYFCPAFQDTFFVYEEDRILGFIIACICETAKTGTIMRVAVHPQAQGRGIASRLIARALDTLKEKQVISVELDVETSKSEVKRLYEKLGFQTSKLVNIDCDYEDEAFYIMELRFS